MSIQQYIHIEFPKEHIKGIFPVYGFIKTRDVATKIGRITSGYTFLDYSLFTRLTPPLYNLITTDRYLFIAPNKKWGYYQILFFILINLLGYLMSVLFSNQDLIFTFTLVNTAFLIWIYFNGFTKYAFKHISKKDILRLDKRKRELELKGTLTSGFRAFTKKGIFTILLKDDFEEFTKLVS